jgi:hypothetical protein
MNHETNHTENQQKQCQAGRTNHPCECRNHIAA